MTAKDFRPEIEQRPQQTYVGATETVTMATISRAADRIPAIISWLGDRGVAPAGAPFLRYRLIDMEGDVVVDAAVPVDDSAIGCYLDDSDLELPTNPGRPATHEPGDLGQPKSMSRNYSHTTSSGTLSGRSPRQLGCRSLPSEVRSL